jgi:hypothetical protein
MCRATFVSRGEPRLILYLLDETADLIEELDGRAVSAIAEAKHRSWRSVIGWVTKNLLSPAPPLFGRHVTL